MSSNVKDVLQVPILFFESLESTNNYAAQLIDADKAQFGTTIICNSQSAGKGQRGNLWQDEPGQSLLMSIVLQPKRAIEQQFSFLAAMAVAIVDAIIEFDPLLAIGIKFPNDIIVNDKKAAGVLIENSIRGSNWTHAIVGIGLNVFQNNFPIHLPNASSLSIESEVKWDLKKLAIAIRECCIYANGDYTFKSKAYLDRYNQMLFKKGQMQRFKDQETILEAKVLGVNEDGQLLLLHEDGIVKGYQHGDLEWVW